MEQPYLNPAALAPLPTAVNDEAGISIKGIASSKLWACRRRRSLFVPQRCQEDFGSAFLSHADFPKAKAKSLSLNRVRKEEFSTQAAHKMMEQVLNMELSFKSYDEKECANASSNITKNLKEKLFNTFDLSGCKVICLCYVTKRAKPSLAIDSGSAWNETKSTADKDTFVDYVYKNQDIVAVASVFLVSSKNFGCTKSAALPHSLPAPIVPLPKARLRATLSGPDSLPPPSTPLPKARSTTFSGPDPLPPPSVPLPKARRATSSESARRVQEVYGDVFFSSLLPWKKNEWMG